MKRRLTALSIVPLMLLAAGCASVQETAETAAKDAASGVATAAADHV
jgi:ABC-type Zn uptake system ZnuABC Zn-binding protein ZnuA